jgi:putative transposase
MTSYIDAHKNQFGVEPICQALQVAPSTYYAATSRPTSARRLRDEELKVEIARVHKENLGVYGIEKVWRQLNREGVRVGRDRAARLMRELNLEGVVRGKRKRTTVAGEVDERPEDLVDRDFRAPAPNRLWVADLTYVSTWSGFVYVAFIIDAFSRSIVGWRVSGSLHAELALDALEMALWVRRNQELEGLVHHSDRGVQYLEGAVELGAQLLGGGGQPQVGEVLAQALVGGRLGVADGHPATTSYSARLRTSTWSPTPRCWRSMTFSVNDTAPGLSSRAMMRAGMGRRHGRSSAQASPTTRLVVRWQRSSTTCSTHCRARAS